MEAIINFWVIVSAFILILMLRLILPQLYKSSLLICIIGAVYFTFKLINNIASDDEFIISNVTGLIIFLVYIIAGGKNVAFKTRTAVFDKIKNIPVGHMEGGSLNWSDPIFNLVTTSPNGEPNISLDLQKVEIKVPETPWMQTGTRGIKVIVREISFMLQIKSGATDEEINQLFDIEDAVGTIEHRIKHFVNEFFLHKVGNLEANKIDTDKSSIIHDLAEALEHKVNKFCKDNHYPYEIVDEVVIGDTELDPVYYEALAKKAIEILTQDAENTKAEAITARLVKAGKTLLPSGTEAEQMNAAKVALGIVKQDIQERKYSLDGDISKLAKELVLLLKK